MDAWIDTYHAVRPLTRQDIRRFPHRQRRRHAGREQPASPGDQSWPRRCRTNGWCRFSRASTRSTSVCATRSRRGSTGFAVARRARRRQDRWPRALCRTCVGAAAAIRAREPRLALGGWANPYADAAQQVDFIADDRFTAEFYLTQVVSHLELAPVERFVDEIAPARPRPRFPACSASSTTAAPISRHSKCLSTFLPVPVEAARASSRPAQPPSTSARGRFARCASSASGTSTSAICRCTMHQGCLAAITARL